MSTPSEPRRGAGPEYDEPAAGRQEGAPEQTFSLYGDRSGDRSGDDAPARDFNTMVRRPAEMWAGAVFLTLAALPLAILGGGLALLPGQFGTNLQQKVSSAGTSISADTLILLFRVGGAVLLVLAVAAIVLAWQAIRPHRKARLWATVLAALEVVGLVAAMVVTQVDPVSLGVALLAAAGALLLFLPRSEEFMRARR